MSIIAIELEKVCDENSSYYLEYERAYERNIKYYQSRIYPMMEAQYLYWYHIKADGKYIGAIWLEKERTEDIPVLGIFIADGNYRSKGIGTEVIKRVIEKDLPNMDTNKVMLRVRAENERAISCYKKVGFIEGIRYAKNGLNILEMIYTCS